MKNVYYIEMKECTEYNKKVVAYDMLDALRKFENYLSERISVDYSSDEVFKQIRSCTFVDTFDDDEYLM